MFANLKAKLLKVDLRKGGKKVFVFESSVRMSAGELEAINEMIDQEVLLGLDSQVVSYSVRKNARTDQPLISYKVNDNGLVEEVKPQGEQQELDLGLPPEKTPIKEEEAEISRDIVEEFILAGLSPRFPDLEYDFDKVVKQHADGDSYLRIASELGLSSGKLAEIMEDYFSRVAPLAAKWEEWREGQRQAAEAVIDKVTGKKEDPENALNGQEYGPDEDDGQPDGEGDEEPQEGTGELSEAKADKEELEEFILERRPHFEDIPYDFPTLLQRRKDGESWLEISSSLGVTKGQLSTKWSAYKKRVKDLLA